MFIYTNYNHLKTLEKSFGLRITKMEVSFTCIRNFVTDYFQSGVGIYKNSLKKRTVLLTSCRGRCCVAWHSRIITVSVSATKYAITSIG